ncbi:hypothetical protein GCM10027161_51710 [Microbispora hainanensis]
MAGRNSPISRSAVSGGNSSRASSAKSIIQSFMPPMMLPGYDKPAAPERPVTAACRDARPSRGGRARHDGSELRATSPVGVTDYVEQQPAP